MSEATHTPGPWRIIPRAHERNGPCIQRGREGGFMVKGMSSEAEDADARLIAAAPDLLAACKEAEEQLSIMAASPASNWWVQKLRAAIAKAEGR